MSFSLSRDSYQTIGNKDGNVEVDGQAELPADVYGSNHTLFNRMDVYGSPMHRVRSSLQSLHEGDGHCGRNEFKSTKVHAIDANVDRAHLAQEAVLRRKNNWQHNGFADGAYLDLYY